MTDLKKRSPLELAESFVNDQLAALEAYRAEDIPKDNRFALRAEAAADALVAKGKIGQVKLEELLRHPSATVRRHTSRIGRLTKPFP